MTTIVDATQLRAALIRSIETQQFVEKENLLLREEIKVINEKNIRTSAILHKTIAIIQSATATYKDDLAQLRMDQSKLKEVYLENISQLNQIPILITAKTKSLVHQIVDLKQEILSIQKKFEITMNSSKSEILNLKSQYEKSRKELEKCQNQFTEAQAQTTILCNENISLKSSLSKAVSERNVLSKKIEVSYGNESQISFVFSVRFYAL